MPVTISSPVATKWATGSTAAALLGRLLLVDGIFAAAALAFLRSAEWYGRRRHPEGVLPYPGPWHVPGGPPRLPTAFAPWYLGFAALSAGGLPLAALVACAAQGCGTAAAVLMLPYLAVFGWQTHLEMRRMRASLLAPAIPIVFAFYRLWQLGHLHTDKASKSK
ncbi:hypothetical protein WJX72_008745 [[Myrmecia] bisecta]|uniref:Glycosyltransferase RgtA/B/C/D-like domain-containing protein n=1 Tax=[Myrmecia] bisecta TaxID=41462 RepID=A0AAW1PNX7_9CHLO